MSSSVLFLESGRASHAGDFESFRSHLLETDHARI